MRGRLMQVDRGRGGGRVWPRRVTRFQWVLAGGALIAGAVAIIAVPSSWSGQIWLSLLATAAGAVFAVALGLTSARVPGAEPEPDPLPDPAGPDGPETVEPPAAAVPRQVPTAASLLVGRSGSIAEGAAYLLRGGTGAGPRGRRVLLVTGPPGVGKTSVAIAVAHAVARAYPDGQLYTTLNDNPGDETVLRRTLAGFVEAFGGGPDDTADVGELRTAYANRTEGRAVLVVLNDVRSAALVPDLLPQGDQCAAIVVSAERVAAADSQFVVEVPPLSEEESLQVLREIVGSERVAAEEPQARTLLADLDGLPLAIRAAAAALAAMPDTKLATVLRRYQARDGGDALDLAYSQLAASEQTTLRAVALLDGAPAERWQLAALLETDNAAAKRSADRLCQANLLVRGRGDAAGLPVYTIHPFVLAYARNRLTAETTREQRTAMLERLDRVRAVLATSTVDLDEVRRGPLDEMDRGLILSAINHARDSVERAREGESAAAEGLALVVFAELRTELGSFDAAEDLAASAVARAADDPLVRLRALRCRARLARRRRRLELSRELLEEALDIALPHRAERVQCLRDKAVTLIHLGELDDADRALADALAIAAEAEMDWVEPKLYWALSLLRERQGDLSRSGAAIAAGLRIARRDNRQLWVAWLGLRQAELHLAERDLPGASRFGFDTMEMFVAMNHRYGKASAGVVTARAFLAMGRSGTARVIFEEALETFVNCGDKWAEAETRRRLAGTLPADEAHEVLDTANSLFSSLGDRDSADQAAQMMALLDRGNGHQEAAHDG